MTVSAGKPAERVALRPTNQQKQHCRVYNYISTKRGVEEGPGKTQGKAGYQISWCHSDNFLSYRYGLIYN